MGVIDSQSTQQQEEQEEETETTKVNTRACLVISIFLTLVFILSGTWLSLIFSTSYLLCCKCKYDFPKVDRFIDIAFVRIHRLIKLRDMAI